MDDDVTYEWLRELAHSLPASSSNSGRELHWTDESHCIAVSRDPQGRIEVFLACPQIISTLPVVRDSMDYQTWYAGDGSEMAANRFVLPSGAHFDAVAALVGVELLKAGFAEDPAKAFKMTEPVIALALRRAVLANEALLGLAGELIVLRELLRKSPEASRLDVIVSWAGSSPSTRDFQLDSTGVEVKTTTGSTSSHFIHGLGQVELGVSVGGVPESSLYLLSLGLRWLDTATGGDCLPGLVDSILLLMPDGHGELLDRIQQYGGDAALGYDHASHRERVAFQRRFELRFERLYDLTDEAIQVLRKRHLDGLEHVNSDSVQYRIDLPAQVRGELNPITGLETIASTLLQKAGFPTA